MRRLRNLRPIAAALAVAMTCGAMSLAPEPAAAAPRPPRRTILFTGDFLATPATWTTAHAYAGGHGFDYEPMLARLRPLASSADLAICHLETPLTGPGVPITDYPNYAVPHQLATAIRAAGYDGCSTASNHSLDHGVAGIRTTLDRLDRLGLGHTGTRRRRGEPRVAAYWVDGMKLAHLSYTASFNGHLPTSRWEANRIDVARILADARVARRHGADIVVLSLHWGVEHVHAPIAAQTSLAERLLRSDALDLIVGHHAHVVQPIRRIHGRYVAYGLGNSLSGMTAAMFEPAVQDGIALIVTAERGRHGWHVERVRYAPTWVMPHTWIVRPVRPALDAATLPDWQLAELRRSWARTVQVVDGARIGIRPFGDARL
jgi:poly-gamma-glutamate synthesis protein (capsule biosynthesis protein)